jgi:hypothetical protein
MATESGLYNTTSTIHNGIISDKLHDSLKLLNLRPALYILMQKAVILNACLIVRTLLAEQWGAWSVTPVLFCEPAKPLWINNNNNNNNIADYEIRVEFVYISLQLH